MARRGAEPIMQGWSLFAQGCAEHRDTLFEHTKEFCASADAQAALIVFSNAGNAFAFAHPSFEAVIGPYLVSTSAQVRARTEVVDPPLTEAEIARRLRKAIATAPSEWEEATEDLGLKELVEFGEAVSEILSLVKKRCRELEAAI